MAIVINKKTTVKMLQNLLSKLDSNETIEIYIYDEKQNDQDKSNDKTRSEQETRPYI
jgi:hypothetical protein